MDGVRRGPGRAGAVGGAQRDISVQTRTCPASPGAPGAEGTASRSRDQNVTDGTSSIRSGAARLSKISW